ncbi:protein of unknown function [Pustulibacterium marinum]|uniref:DUF4920 domain-containing protein n=1 Tax=Pustulibacterium marinum TaxID=1224947 RepID=A0A1I7FD95_9FLAO|nr:DUF4920 domain-containing protein [Pustulibacterium marinum]SFU34066.1 protein of unknown function [Pustulibacterium marinum]
MKKLLYTLAATLILTACTKKTNYKSFGEQIEADGAVEVSKLAAEYKDLKPGDSLEIKFEGTIDEVCQKKGCWMTVDLGDNKETFVRFKDYGFFVPLNAGKREAVVSGKAFVTETSVDELRHYAKDAGKTEEEISQITEPKKEYAFLANGVLIEENEVVTE